MTASAPSPKWYWETTDPNHSGSSGDLSKLFKNENVKQPGVFSVGAPSADATILAREVIQNSWDAAIELREDSDDTPPFEIRFRFGSALAERKRQVHDRRVGRDPAARAGSAREAGRVGRATGASNDVSVLGIVQDPSRFLQVAVARFLFCRLLLHRNMACLRRFQRVQRENTG